MSGSILEAAGRDVYRLSFEISPIILVGGIAQDVPGQMLPIVALTEAANFVSGLLSGGSAALNLDNFLAHFRPMPGATLVENQIGAYPFANQTIAANAIIAQPLRLSMIMDVPVRLAGGHTAKLLTFMALQRALNMHSSRGGTFTVATPANIYTSMVLLEMRDASHGGDKQVQSSWQFDFIKPLVTLEDAAQSQNGLMSALSNGTATDGSTSGLSGSLGSGSGATPSLVPAASNLAGASASGDLSAGVATPGFVYQAPTVAPVTKAAL